MKMSFAEILVMLDGCRISESLCGATGGSYKRETYFDVRKAVTERLGQLTLDVKIEDVANEGASE